MECPNCGGNMSSDQHVTLRWICTSCSSKYDMKLIGLRDGLVKYAPVTPGKNARIRPII